MVNDVAQFIVLMVCMYIINAPTTGITCMYQD